MADEIAIVIFGAAVRPDGRPSVTLRKRVEAAALFGAAHPGALFVPTGAVGRHGPSEASVMADLLRRAGVPGDRIVLEEAGTDTLSSARACVLLLRRRGFQGRVFAASSDYHLPRCVALLRIGGLDAHRCPPPRVPAARSFGKRWYWRLREALALPYDIALGLLLRGAGRFWHV
jgi:uncharacterized SAM-binding protein YcdF (DUF218 family)